MNRLLAILAPLVLCVGCAAQHDGMKSDWRVGNQNLSVKSARYGRGSNWVDVTEQIRALSRNGSLVLPKNLYTTLDVDPDPGYMKYVEMVLVINGEEVQMRVADNLQLEPLRLVTRGVGEASDK